MSERYTNLDLFREIADLRAELVKRDEEIKNMIDQTYLRIKQYEADIYPIKRFVYGMVAVAGGALLTAVIGLAISVQ